VSTEDTPSSRRAAGLDFKGIKKRDLVTEEKGQRTRPRKREATTKSRRENQEEAAPSAKKKRGESSQGKGEPERRGTPSTTTTSTFHVTDPGKKGTPPPFISGDGTFTPRRSRFENAARQKMRNLFLRKKEKLGNTAEKKGGRGETTEAPHLREKAPRKKLHEHRRRKNGPLA